MNYSPIPSECNLVFERKVNEELWYTVMPKKYCDGEESFENDIFAIKPYNWATIDEDITFEESWNFWHKPSGFKIGWYKHPMRGASCNFKITNQQFLDILYDCTNSLNSFVQHHVIKWWETFSPEELPRHEEKQEKQKIRSKEEVEKTGLDRHAKAENLYYKENRAASLLRDWGYENTIIYDDYSYDTAFVGVTEDGRAVYEYNKMIDWLEHHTGWDYEDCVDWIDYNTLNAKVENGPIVIYNLE